MALRLLLPTVHMLYYPQLYTSGTKGHYKTDGYLMAGDEYGSPDADTRNPLSRGVLEEGGAEVVMVGPGTGVLWRPRIRRRRRRRGQRRRQVRRHRCILDRSDGCG